MPTISSIIKPSYSDPSDLKGIPYLKDNKVRWARPIADIKEFNGWTVCYEGITGKAIFTWTDNKETLCATVMPNVDQHIITYSVTSSGEVSSCVATSLELQSIPANVWLRAARNGYRFKPQDRAYGWYSVEAEKTGHLKAYIYLSWDNKEVTVNSVTNSPHRCGMNWTDTVFIGRLRKLLRSATPALPTTKLLGKYPADRIKISSESIFYNPYEKCKKYEQYYNTTSTSSIINYKYIQNA